MTGKRRIDRITAEEYLQGVAERPIDALRTMRDECLEEETVLSFERRLLQGRMDILRAELERRGGKEGSLIDRLPAILAADERPASRGGFPGKDPVLDFDVPKRRVEQLISDGTLANLAALSVDDVERIVTTLVEAEREVSESRRTVQRVLDSLSAEIGRRYKTGEADPADLLTR